MRTGEYGYKWQISVENLLPPDSNNQSKMKTTVENLPQTATRVK